MLRIVVAGRSTSALKSIAQALSGMPDTDVSTAIIEFSGDVPSVLASAPDVLVLHVEAQRPEDLAAFMDLPAEQRPGLVVVGAAGDSGAMRLAIKAGARDYLPEPVSVGDLLAAIEELRSEPEPQRPTANGAMTVLIGAAGGVGTTFLASNIAHQAVAEGNQRSILVDLDVQFSPVAHYLGLKPERGLLEALESVDSIDEHSLTGFTAQHRSGLQTIGVVSSTMVTASAISAQRLSRLLSALTRHYQHVFVDSPHHLDALNSTALGAARNVGLVLQQSVAQVRNAATLLQVLTRDVGVQRGAIQIIVNRYDRNAAVQLSDIRETLGVERIHVVPSAYEPALGSIDTGIPLGESSRSSPLGEALLDVLVALGGERRQTASGLWKRLPFFNRK